MTGAAEKPDEAGGAEASTEVGHAAASPERVKTKKTVGAGGPGPAGAVSVPLVGRGTAGKEACERAAAGDPEALALWREFGEQVGDLVMLVLYAYDPEAIVFGGSISRAFEFFRGSMFERLRAFPYAKTVERLHICCSKVENVGLLGASEC